MGSLSSLDKKVLPGTLLIYIYIYILYLNDPPLICNHPPRAHPLPYSIHLGPARASPRLLTGPGQAPDSLKEPNLGPTMVPLGPDPAKLRPCLGPSRSPSPVPKPASFYLIALVSI